MNHLISLFCSACNLNLASYFGAWLGIILQSLRGEKKLVTGLQKLFFVR